MHVATEHGPAFTTGQVCRLTGVTPRQLDHWAWTGFLQPSGAGAVKRRYSFDDLVRIRAVTRLKDLGVTMELIRKAVDRLSGQRAEAIRDLILVGLDGDVVVHHGWPEARSALDGQTAFLCLDLAGVVRETETIVRRQAHAPLRAADGAL